MSQSLALWRKQFRQMVNTGILLRRQSRFKIGFVLFFAITMETALFLLFLDGFRFLDSLGGPATFLTGRLFSLFFFAMGLMLVLSAAITAYASLYRSDEIPFLVSHPFATSNIVTYKIVEATGLSSWAFFFMVLPFVSSYAWQRKLHFPFVFWTVIFSIPLLFLSCAAGAIVAMMVVRWMPRKKGLLFATIGTMALYGIMSGVRATRALYSASEEDFRFALSKLVPGLSLASHPMMPSWWVSEGIMSLSSGDISRGLRLLALVTTSAAVSWVAVEQLGNLIFLEGWHRLTAGSFAGRRRAILFAFLDRITSSIVPHDIRAMLLKDLRTFFRDPIQWSQVVIFFGLLGLYYANLRSFHYHTLPQTWRNTVAFLNVFSVTAVICSLGSRFVYPQLSLEGQGFWILGLAPTSMARILATKFVFSAIGMAAISMVLMGLSSAMLEATPLVRAVAIGVAALISVATCGLSTGLGGIFMNLEQRNPAAIVSGFGGTLNLTINLGIMLAVIFPFGFIFHLRNIGRIGGESFWIALAGCSLWSVLATVLATAIPLKVATTALRRREF